MSSSASHSLNQDVASLSAICPLDGRYAEKVKCMSAYFSEYALIKKRVEVEVMWFLHLSNNGVFDLKLDESITNEMNCLMDLSLEDAIRIKEIEKKTNHDVKSVELFIKEKIRKSDIQLLINNIEMIHFGCTSEDINNLSYALILKECVRAKILPTLHELLNVLKSLAVQYADAPMLSLTHGQSATPTTFGKEIAIFAKRLDTHINHSLLHVKYKGKMNGAVGNFNAHFVAMPNVNWPCVSKCFVENVLKLDYQDYSSQIECHDYIAELCDCIARLNSTLIDLNIDLWIYISRELLKLKKEDGEVGSSTMPHKINPIDFENSEGNLGLANALLKFFSSKLPISRMQRDLSDSTVMRNLGLGFSYSYLAYISCLKGLRKICVDEIRMKEDLQCRWQLLAEPIQTVLRKYNSESPYEQLKGLTRGKSCTEENIKEIIKNVCKNVSQEDLDRLLNLSPDTYLGIAETLARKIYENTECQ